MEKIRGDKRTVKAEKRTSERHHHQGTITFSIFNRQKCIDAQSLDYSKNGLRFKSTCALQPGTTICIRVKSGQGGSRPDRLAKSMPSVGLAEVKWCRQLDGSESPFYEAGVRYYPPDY
jgi:hypothetical protein